MLDPREFDRWFDSTMVLSRLDQFSIPNFDDQLTHIRRSHDELVLTMILRLFFLEQLRPPNSFRELMTLAADELSNAVETRSKPDH